MDFDDRVKLHLGGYKEQFLGIEQDGFWKKDTRYPKKHILPPGQEDKNFLPGIDIPESVTLHQYYYHLNSSQVMCINFFAKLSKNPTYFRALVKVLLGMELGGQYKTIFEYEPGRREGTNFDFYIGATGKNIYWEIKYTEAEFARTTAESKTRDNSTHLKKFEDVYRPHLAHSKYLRDTDQKTFLENYQIYRNISWIKDDTDYMVFLYPFDNKKLHAQLNAVLERQDFHNIFQIDWHQACKTALDIVKNDDEYCNYYQAFKAKYLDY